MMERVILAALLSANFTAAQAATFYVSTNGDDTAAGGQSSPWATLSYAATQISAGDTVLVNAGSYAENILVTASGSAGAPITFEAVGQVTMEGFRLDGDHLQVKGFYIRTLACDGQDSFGIEARGDHFVLENNDIYEMPNGGIYTSATSQSGQIINNRLERNVQTGIELHGSDHQVIGNEIINPIERHPITACRDGGDDANGVTFFGSGHSIRGNFIHGLTYSDPNVLDAHIDCFQTFGSWVAGEVNDNVMIEDNICEALSYQNADENGNGLYIEEVSNLTIRNNVFLTYGGIGADADVTNLIVVNNTFVSAMDIGGAAGDHRGIDLWHQSVSGGMIRNNIFVDFRGGPYYLNSQIQTLAHSNNLMYWTDDQDRSESWWTFQCHQNANVCADPELTDPANLDFHISSTSPAIDVGSANVPVSDDITGTARPQGLGFDLGAYEPQPSSPPAQPTVIHTADFSNGLSGWYTENNISVVAGVVEIEGGSAWMSRTFSTQGYTDIEVSIQLGAADYEASESLVLYWSDGSGWKRLYTIRNGHVEEDGQL